MRSITWPTLLGTVRLVASDTTIITANASGTVQMAGCPSSTAPQPPCAAPNIVAIIAARHEPPPTTMPAAAPTLVSPRHQMPSTISGQNEEAAIANAQPTSRASENRLISSAAVVANTPAVTAEQPNV